MNPSTGEAIATVKFGTVQDLESCIRNMDEAEGKIDNFQCDLEIISPLPPFSTINQSTGAYCFDKWVAYYRTRRPNIIGQFHDESINLVKKGDEQIHTDALLWAIKKLNEELKLNVDLGIDVQYGQRYSDIH